MEGFCDTPFWNITQVWEGSWPQFTSCFQDTVLIWVPCGWLWVISLFYVYTILAHYRSQQQLHGNKLFIAKMLSCGLLFTTVVARLVVHIQDHTDAGDSVVKADVFALVVLAVTVILSCFLTALERHVGFITSGVQFIFWILLLVTQIIPFYTLIKLQVYDTNLMNFGLFYVQYAFILLIFLLHCFAEKISRPFQPVKVPCPETEASFLSRLTFWWATRLQLQGFKMPLTEEVMPDLNPREKACNVVPTFLNNWNKEIKTARARCKIQQYKEQRRSSFYHNHGSVQRVDETTPLIISGSDRRKEDKSKEKKPLRPKASLLKILFKTFGLELLRSQIWKLLYDALILTNPLVLGQLVKFIQDSSSPVWKGYLFAFILYLSMQLQSFFFHQLFHLSTSLGLHIRTSLISAIFRKSLTMNNQARRESTVGEVVNLMSVDCEHIESMLSYMWAVWSSPLQICVSLYLLYQTLGPPMFAGLGLLLVMMPVNGLVMTKLGSFMNKLMAQKDKRMKLLNEVLNGMKILKLYAWEPSFSKQISDVRDKELGILWSYTLWGFAMTICWTVVPYLVSLLTFVTYIFTSPDHYLRPETAFVAISLFNVLRFAISFAPMMITECIHAVISVRRINRYLNRDDLDPDAIVRDPQLDHAISIRNGTFMWNPELGPTLKNINIHIPEGALVAVVGQVGVGKSSLISAMIGDMEKVEGRVSVKGSVAYVPQQAWIQNDTVRNNILFGKTMRQRGYDDCLAACALGPDLEILSGGDLTEIGERGINLSGGQKQRVSLARAVYSDSDVYLMDDPLSAVDSHVGKHIFEEVIGKSGLLKDKTRVLVTHGVHWLPLVDQVIVMKNGIMSEIGTYDELLSHNGPFAHFLKTYFLQQDKQTDEEDDPEVKEMRRQVLQRLESVTGEDSEDSSDEEAAPAATEQLSRQESTVSEGKAGEEKEKKDKEKGDNKDKLIEEEKVEIGKVHWDVFREYAHSVGYVFAFLIIVLYILYEASSVLSNIWLSAWTDDADLNNLTAYPANSSHREDLNNHYLGLYGGFGALQLVFVSAYSIIEGLRTIHAARILHQKMLTRIFQVPMSFFDTTPVGRIINRFSQDIDAIDTELPMTFFMGLDSFSVVMSTLVVISYSTPYFLVAIVPLFVLYFIIQRFYIPTSRQLKRLESKTRSPIYNFFGETLSGASVIRAYAKESSFIKESERRVDTNQIFGFSSFSANRWLGFRLEFLGNVIVLIAASVAVALRDSISGGIVGLSVSYALEVTTNLNWLVRMMSDLETQIVSVERVKEYTELVTEAPWKRRGHRPPPTWPQNGQVTVDKLSLRYRPELDLVLKDIAFNVQPGEKIGIVGRTGAGKSSLTLALFRLIEPAGGQIRLDNLNIANLGLHDLRSKLTILPQDPVIFAGTVRMNLDPFGNFSDAQVWQALEHAHLKTFIDSLPDSLQHECGEGGENLSVGQRQLLCLARSLLHKTKILILDEATAAVDMETDDLIQQTIRDKFQDCTVLTIAHRLNTVMDYDKILVLDKGEIAEFDAPANLLNDTDGIFYSMAHSAGLVS